MIDDPKLLTIDDYDEAWLGLCTCWDGNTLVQRAVYDGQVMLEVLMKSSDMSMEDAEEYISFNIEGAYHGPSTPIIVWRVPMEFAEELSS